LRLAGRVTAHERLVGRLELALEESADDGQREAALLKVTDAAKALEVALAVPGTLPPAEASRAALAW